MTQGCHSIRPVSQAVGRQTQTPLLPRERDRGAQPGLYVCRRQEKGSAR